MSATDSFFKFIGSKWFILVLGIGLIIALPFTWHNLKVVFSAGQAGKYWYLVGVFIINALSVLLCSYKFMSLLTKKSNQTPASSEW
jgi:hypothetical protein